jgi:hypothetical protein
MNTLAYDAPHMPFSLPQGNIYNSPNMQKGTVAEELSEDQQPLGAQFKSYQLNQAVNYYLLNPFQYSITKFDYNVPGKKPMEVIEPENYKNDPGLIYRNVNFEKLLPAFTATKKSVNDFPAQSYHRFLANDGYFNPNESVDNSDLWYYGANNNARTNGFGIAGAALNVQDPNHIIFPEPQRGGTDTRNLTKYSWSNFKEERVGSWESEGGVRDVNNDINCQNFNYNNTYTTDRNALPFNRVYNFDSDYCRNIGISGPYEGSMPYFPAKIN